MKKLLTVVLSAFAFASCSNNNSQGSISNDSGTNNKIINPGDNNF